MKPSKSLIGVKIVISKDSSIPLFKGKNLIYYKDLFSNSISQEEDKILFALNCSSDKSITLRTFSKYPLILKKNNSTTRYMNDSLVSLEDISQTKIFPLLEQNSESIVFEQYEVPKEKKEKENKEKETNDFLDNIIEYFEKDGNKSSILSDRRSRIFEYETKPYEIGNIRKESENEKEEITSINISNVAQGNEEKKIKIMSSIIQPKEKKKRIRNKKDLLLDDEMIQKALKDNKDNLLDEIKAIKEGTSLPQSDATKTKRPSIRYSFRKKITKVDKDYDELVPSSKKPKEETFLKKRNRTRTFSDMNLTPGKVQPMQKCPICLDIIKEPSQLNTCHHEFCKECIDHWTQLSSQCPLCKENFTKVIYYDMRSHNTTEKKIKKKHFKPDEEEVEQWYTNCDDKCLICGKCDNTQELLVCDKCDFRICHTYCVGLDIIPEGDWICPECIKKAEKKKRRIKRKNLPRLNIELRDRVPKRHSKYSLRLKD